MFAAGLPLLVLRRLKFLFFGGILTAEHISQIQLQTEELEVFDFVSPEKAIPLLSNSLQKSVPASLKAIQDKTVAYIEAQGTA